MIARDDTRTNVADPEEDPVYQLTRTVYYAQNWRGDVVGLLNVDGSLFEHVRYTSYGRPVAITAANVSGNGTSSIDDIFIYQNLWFGNNQYADFNMDGIISIDDLFLHQNAWFTSSSGGVDALASGSGNRKGFAGYEHDPVMPLLQLARHRYYRADLAAWTSRDPIGYIQDRSLYLYARCSPISLGDPTGLIAVACRAESGGSCGGGTPPNTSPSPTPTILPTTTPSTTPTTPTVEPDKAKCPSDETMNDPGVQEAMREAQAMCNCTPTIKCTSIVPDGGGTALPRLLTLGCPAILVNPTTTPDVIRHELRHAWQFCKHGITDPFSACEELICRELDAYDYQGECDGPNAAKIYGSKDACLCSRACDSVNAWAGGICNLLNDCKRKCEKMQKKGSCKDGHFTPPRRDGPPPYMD